MEALGGEPQNQPRAAADSIFQHEKVIFGGFFFYPLLLLPLEPVPRLRAFVVSLHRLTQALLRALPITSFSSFHFNTRHRGTVLGPCPSKTSPLGIRLSPLDLLPCHRRRRLREPSAPVRWSSSG